MSLFSPHKHHVTEIIFISLMQIVAFQEITNLVPCYPVSSYRLAIQMLLYHTLSPHV